MFSEDPVMVTLRSRASRSSCGDPFVGRVMGVLHVCINLPIYPSIYPSIYLSASGFTCKHAYTMHRMYARSRCRPRRFGSSIAYLLGSGLNTSVDTFRAWPFVASCNVGEQGSATTSSPKPEEASKRPVLAQDSERGTPCEVLPPVH